MSIVTDESDLERLRVAEGNFMAGRFAEAGSGFAALAGRAPGDRRVLLRMGQIALLEQRLDAAIHWLLGAGQAGADAGALLAEAYYRARRYAEAAECHARLGQSEIAQHLRAFGGLEPYRVVSTASGCTLEFLTREPLPLVRVLVNGAEEALFVFDTGTWDTVLDAKLARRIGLRRGWTGQVRCATGAPAWVEYSHLPGLNLGALELADLPVQVMDLGAALPGFFEPHGVDGVLGLGVLSRFGVELDMPAGELRLSRSAPQLDDDAIPCWLGSGRQLLAWGGIGPQPTLWFVDTGMTGFDCLLPVTTAAAAQLGGGLGAPVVGYGGGGQAAFATAESETMTLGGFCKSPANCVISPAFPLERCYGFRIGGLLALEFLKQAVLSIDFAAMRLRVRASG